jgi:hypothetical protein
VFANLLQLLHGRDPADFDRPFITAVQVKRPRASNPRVERFILAGWLLIAVKHVAVIWAVHHYAVPFHQLWVNFPTFLLGLVATWAYYVRE